MSFDDDFGDIFEDFDIFKLMRKSRSELDKILGKVWSGEMKGTWEMREIDEPGVKGYAIRGYFGSEEPLAPLGPLEPLKPLKRRPLPEKPFDVPKGALKEMREPLVDIFEEDNAVRVYVELPGVEKDEIKLNFGEDCVEVKTKNFYKTIELPNGHIAKENVSTEYKNGVLQITILKANQLRKEDAKNLKAL